MPLIWCSISAHGFGHAAQAVPVLNELGRLVPDVTVILRTTVPRHFFEPRLRIPWELSAVEQDIGCVQHGPLQIDVEATWRAYTRFHAHWERRVGEEADAIAHRAPQLILANISHLALAAGTQTKILAVGLSSLSWDQVVQSLVPPDASTADLVRRQIEHGYAGADMMIRVNPGLSMPAFRRVVDVGPIAAPPPPQRAALRSATKTSPDECLVVIGFGGVSLTALPWAQMDQMVGYRFLVPGVVPAGVRRAMSTDGLPFPFQTIMVSGDILLTKPGYSSLVEAVISGVPVVYVRRYNFPDEPVLLEYLHHYGRAIELSAERFHKGDWESAFEAVAKEPASRDSAPPHTGARQAATILAHVLGRQSDL